MAGRSTNLFFFLPALAATLLASAGVARAEWLPLDPLTAGDTPRTTVIEASAEGVTVEVRFPGVEAEGWETAEGAFAWFRIPDTGQTPEIGAPLLPVLREAVRLPLDATPILTVLATDVRLTSLEELGLPDRILPARPPVPKLPDADPDAPLVWDADAYEVAILDPGVWAELGEIGQRRAHRFVPVEVFPVRHTPTTGEVQLLERIEIRIEFEGADWPATQESMDRYATPDGEAFAERHLIAGGALAPRARVELPMGYLIIAHDSLADAVRDLAGFRHRQGFDVTLVATSQIPGGASAQSIKSYIEDAYHSWPVPPAFVLLVGDTGQIPAFNGSYCYSATDLYYGTMDGGGDWQPDIYVGRFPAASAADAARMATKTLDYTRFSLGSGGDWIHKATFMASVDNSHISQGTHDYCIGQWLAPDGYDCTKRYTHQGATTWQVIDDINGGLSQLTYSGHGYTQGWSDGPPMDASQVASLVNVGKLPVVQSYACYTGDYAGNSFGETWLKASNGAVAFWGSSQTSYWNEDDVLQRAAYDAWYGGGYHWFRGSLDEGLFEVSQVYGGSNMARAYHEQYNLLGDPALDVWTDAPAQLDVGHAGEIAPSTAAYAVDVSTAGGPPVADALVCLHLEGAIHAAAYTDGAGHAEIPLDGTPPEGAVLDLTVSAHDHVPWADGVPVSDSGPGPGDDDDDGDDDTGSGDDDDGSGGHDRQDGPSIQAGCQCRSAAASVESDLRSRVLLTGLLVLATSAHHRRHRRS